MSVGPFQAKMGKLPFGHKLILNCTNIYRALLACKELYRKNVQNYIVSVGRCLGIERE